MVTNIQFHTKLQHIVSITTHGERVGMSSVVIENWVHLTKTVMQCKV